MREVTKQHWGGGVADPGSPRRVLHRKGEPGDWARWRVDRHAVEVPSFPGPNRPYSE